MCSGEINFGKVKQTEKLNLFNVPAPEAADARLVLSECGRSFWIKSSFCTVGAEGAWPDQAQTLFRVTEELPEVTRGVFILSLSV